MSGILQEMTHTIAISTTLRNAAITVLVVPPWFEASSAEVKMGHLMY